MTCRDAMCQPKPAGIATAGARWAATAIALALIAPAAAAQDVASLGGAGISAAEVERLARQVPELRQQLVAGGQAFENTLRRVLIQRAILKEAQSKGWDKRPEVAESIETAKNAAIVSSYLASMSPLPLDYPSEAEVSSAFEQNKARLFTPWSYHLAQIYVQRPADQGKVEAAANRAAQLAEKARKSGADFAAIAKAESEDEASKERGGDTGWVFEPSLLPEVRALALHLKPGEIGGPVLTPRGWHIVKLLESRPPAPASLDQAKEAVANALRAEKVANLRQAYLDRLVNKSPVKFDQAALARLIEKFRSQK